jgi:hypothetical protein
MRAPATRRDEVSPWAHTVPANPAELRRQIERVFERIDAKPQRRLEPEMYWEEPGLHGPNGRVRLRPRAVVGEVPRARHAETGRIALPPAPRASSHTQLLVVGGVALGALALYLLTRKPSIEMEGTMTLRLHTKPEVLPAWAMT